MTQDQLDTLVRDLTSVVPRSKSEVRCRILELLATQRNKIEEKVRNLTILISGDSPNRALLDRKSVLEIIEKK